MAEYIINNGNVLRNLVWTFSQYIQLFISFESIGDYPYFVLKTVSL